MKKIFLSALLFSITFSFAQNKFDAEKLVNEGIPYHDKGDYEGAINKYNQALKLDKDNVLALGEKAFSLLSLKKYEEAIDCCKLAIEKHPDDKALNTIYVTYGNSLDELKKTDKALEIYDEGLKKFPNYYQLHFNKGITYSSIKKYNEAISSFQNAVLINPKHGSSYNAMARLENLTNSNRIPAILAFSRFFIVEPNSDRAAQNLTSLKEIMMRGVEKTGKKSININIDSSILSDSTAVKKENNFASTDMILSMTASLDYHKKNAKKSEVENFIRKFETICSSLEETKKGNSGFYWDFLVPYFIEMKNKKLIEPFAYIVYSSSGNEDVDKWLKDKDFLVDKFYDWSKEYKWKTSN